MAALHTLGLAGEVAEYGANDSSTFLIVNQVIENIQQASFLRTFVKQLSAIQGSRSSVVVSGQDQQKQTPANDNKCMIIPVTVQSVVCWRPVVQQISPTPPPPCLG